MAMESEVFVKITSKGVEVLNRDLQNATKTTKGLETAGQKATRSLSSGFGTVSKEARALGYAIQAAVAGAAVKKIVDSAQRWGVLQTKMRLTNAEVVSIRERMEQASASVGKTTDSGVAMLEVFQDFGGVTKDMLNLAPALLKFSAATGTADADTAKLAATLKKTLGMSDDQILQSLLRLNAQADAGNIAFSELAQIAPKVLAGAATKGFAGIAGVEQIMPIVQVLGAAGKSADEASSAINAMFSDLTKESSLKFLSSKGIQVFTDKNKNKLRDVRTIFEEIIGATGGDMTQLAQVFGEQGKTVADAFAAGMQQKGGLDSIFKAASDSNVDQLFEKFAQGAAKPAVELQKNLSKIESALMNFGTKVANFVAENPAAAAIFGISAVGAWKGRGWAAGKILGNLKGGGGAGTGGGIGGAGLPGVSDLGVQKVFVVNMGGGMGGGVAGVPGAGIPTAPPRTSIDPYAEGWGRKAGLTMGSLASAAMVAQAALVGVGIGRAIAETLGTDDAISEFLTGIHRNLAKGRTETFAKNAVVQNTLATANQLVGLKNMGVSTAEVAPGVRKEITAENFFPKLVEAAKAQGVKGEDLANLITKLDELSKQMADSSQITVINQSGVKDLEFKRGAPL